jgi:hypothetical protein
VAVAAGLVLASCKGSTPAGTPYSQQFTRELEAHFDRPIGDVHATARRVLEEDMEYVITEDALDALEGMLKADTARGRTVRVETWHEGESLTRVQVWVSPMGDEEMSAELLDRIQQAL